MRGLENVVVSALARVEVAAAIWWKSRAGELSPEDAAVLVEGFEWDWLGDRETPGMFAVVVVSPEILETAAHRLALHPLRAYDAVQLATALAAREADPELIQFACADVQLARAAAIEGFRVVA